MFHISVIIFPIFGRKKSPVKLTGDFSSTNRRLCVDLGDNTGTNGSATLTDSKAQAFFDSDRSDQLNVEIQVVAGHSHLSALGQGDDAGNVEDDSC